MRGLAESRHFGPLRPAVRGALCPHGRPPAAAGKRPAAQRKLPGQRQIAGRTNSSRAGAASGPQPGTRLEPTQKSESESMPRIRAAPDKCRRRRRPSEMSESHGAAGEGEGRPAHGPGQHLPRAGAPVRCVCAGGGAPVTQRQLYTGARRKARSGWARARLSLPPSLSIPLPPSLYLLSCTCSLHEVPFLRSP